MNKRVACYALFGNRSFYWAQLPALVRAHRSLFPGWELVIYSDSSYYSPRAKLLRAYAEDGLLQARFYEENKGRCRSMLWRLLPLWEDSVEYLLCRDMDSLPVTKDRRAVEHFIASKAVLHCINDNPGHTAPIMGGMCGFKARTMRSMLAANGINSWEQLVAKYDLTHEINGLDQDLLLQEIWPMCNPTLVCEHRFAGYPTSSNCAASYTTVANFLLPDIDQLLDGSDSLAPYLGSAGYPVGAAAGFFHLNGPRVLMDRIEQVEKDAGFDHSDYSWKHHHNQVILVGHENDPDVQALLQEAVNWKAKGWTPHCVLSHVNWFKSTANTQAVLRGLHELDSKIVWMSDRIPKVVTNGLRLAKIYMAGLINDGSGDDTINVAVADEAWAGPRYGTTKQWREVLELERWDSVAHAVLTRPTFPLDIDEFVVNVGQKMSSNAPVQ